MYYVPHNSVVRIPKRKGYGSNCYKVCRCGKKNQLQHCKDMGCVTPSICTIGHDFKGEVTVLVGHGITGLQMGY